MKKIIFLLLWTLSISTILGQQQESRFLIKNIDINNKFLNFGTTFYGSNNIVYSSSNSKNGMLDLFLGSIDKNGEIVNSKKMPGLSTKSHESNVVFTKDQKTVYFTRSIYGKSNTLNTGKNRESTIAIFKADVAVSGKWTNITPMPFNSEYYDVAHPSLSSDNKKLYFISNMPGTLGDNDIFVVDVNSDGSFGRPKNMGSKVNSINKEMFPHIDDNNVLFFSSNRKDEAYGGLDIFAVKIYENGDISERLHLEPPINSIYDDFSYIFDHNKKHGYFSSNRKDGKGSDDIYFFTETRPLLFDCFQKITGTVIDNRDGKSIPFADVSLRDGDGNELEKITTGKDGKFSFSDAVCDTGYELLGKKKHYAEKIKQFITSSRHDGQTVMSVKLSDDFIIRRRGKMMLNIYNINFDYNESFIRPDAAAQLDRVVVTMNRYPNMVIELGAHTDSRGRDLYNLILSNKRAKSVISYIISKGISSDRISGKGYGERILLNDCTNANRNKCTDKEHEINRRSEFVITKM
jgi:outer membrane protein OmpA-like peptidoglycan-associated protein